MLKKKQIDTRVHRSRPGQDKRNNRVRSEEYKLKLKEHIYKIRAEKKAFDAKQKIELHVLELEAKIKLLEKRSKLVVDGLIDSTKLSKTGYLEVESTHHGRLLVMEQHSPGRLHEVAKTKVGYKSPLSALEAQRNYNLGNNVMTTKYF